MGVVYEALDERIDRSVALKLMRLDTEQADDRARLRREAQALARLSHPNVVEVFEVGEHEGKAYVAMELVDGHPLDRWLRLRRRSPQEIVERFVQAGEGLAAAHAEDLVHRDFKPGNVLVGSDGRVRVVDFGLVRQSADSSSQRAPEPGRPSPAVLERFSRLRQTWSRELTRTGTMVGTPAYMSPEQLGGLPIGPASDQFSFCTALFEALLGVHPHVVGNDWQRLPFNVLEGNLQRPRPERRVPPTLVRALIRGLSVRPEDRWPSMTALLHELRRSIAPARPRVGPIALALGAVIATGLTWSAVTQAPDHCDDLSTQMRARWNVQTRDAIQRAWQDPSLLGGSEAWARADDHMTHYADDWWAAYRETCGLRDPVAASVACLQRRIDTLGARLEIMAEPDETMVHNLVPMLSQLPSPHDCAGGDPRPAATSEPDDPVWAAELDEIDARLQAGQFETAASLLDTLMSRADLRASPRLAALVNLRLGLLQKLDARLDAASRTFENAYLHAKQFGLDEAAARAAIAMLQIHGEDLYREAEAERWAGHAYAEVQRVRDPVLRSEYLNAAGRALRAKGDLEGALHRHERALALQREHLPPGHHRTGDSLFHIGSCLGLRGRIPEALEALRQSLAIYQEALGPRHPRVSRPLSNIGAFLLYAGRDDDALASFEQSLEILGEAFPDNSLATRYPYINISEIQASQGRHADAAQTLRTYREHYRRSLVDEDLDPAHFEDITCMILTWEGAFEDATRHCDRAVEANEEQLGTEHTSVADALIRRGNVSARLGRFDEAIADYERAISIHEDPKAGDRLPIGTALTGIAAVREARGDWAAARASLERARSVYQEVRDGEHPKVASTDVALARIELEQGMASAASERLSRAQQTLEHHYGDASPHLVDALAVGAEALRQTGASERARSLARRALSVAKTNGGPPDAIARARFTLARCLGPSRSEARALARRALDDLPPLGALATAQRERIERWLSQQP